MKRAALTIVTTVAGLAVLLGFKTSPIGDAVAGFAPDNATSSAVSQGSGSSGSGSGSGAGSSGAGSGAGPSPNAQAKQTATGTAARTPYGPVQLRVTSTGGRISNVEVLQAPWSNGTDQQINGYALPILIKETITSQSATIDMVSGASYTSHGYVTSLQSALDQLNA
ncbi:MAG: FMN-binding protein [Actinomycetota bacterium]|nr:FMN-binding protein [Actinomycetota bacterium]